ncbi:unnamed protein product, partial [Mesorhabditis belari]|uniref:Acyl-coenzyme A thioesterase 8 n=1 Tax=Mesorhabditis belari TaxID=2138241 RepID=A0AAF3FG91_9BILA
MKRLLNRAILERIAAGGEKFSVRKVSSSPPLHTSFYNMGRQRFSLEDKNGSRASDAESFARRVGNFYTLEEKEKDVFVTPNLSTVRGAAVHAAYGGLIFSQALCAAEKTVEERFKPHATHSFFILNVDTRIPCEYHVRRLRDGKSFCTRTVEAIQNGKVAFCLQVSFHVNEPDSVVHEAKMPDVPPPEECVTNRDFAIFTLEKVAAGEVTVTEMQRKRLEFQANYDPDGDLFEIEYENFDSDGGLFEIRCVAPDTHLGFSEPSTSRTVCFWMKTQFPVPSCSERLHRYLLAFTSDSVLAGSAYLPHLINDFSFSMLFSLDHCVWFHEPIVKSDDWMLYECRSDKARGSRGFTEGRMWSRDGRVIMTATQEALVRSKGSVSKI